MDDKNTLLLRSNEASSWDDEMGKSYHFGSAVKNYRLIKPRARFLLDRKTQKGAEIIGNGVIGKVIEEGKDQRGRQNYRAEFEKFEAFHQPIQLSGDLRRRLQNQPNYNKQFSVRILTENFYNHILLLNNAQKRNLNGITTFDIQSVHQFYSFINISGFFGVSKMQESFLASVCTKPFVILTGNSGSGKTKLALLFTQWLEARNKVEITADAANNASLRVGSAVSAMFKPFRSGAGKDNYVAVELTGDSQPRDATVTVDEHECVTLSSSVTAPFGQWLKTHVGEEFVFSVTPGKPDGAASVLYKVCLMPSRHTLVPVGADWTDNRQVLGFVNHLKTDDESGRPTFQSTPILNLLLRAKDDREHPYFIILDEMNLSHVERYFSDFLSAMESGEPVPVHAEGDPLPTSSGDEVPSQIEIPPNVFVIGTVNVDETTYMFSPKVLDRANVIEFRVENEDLESYFDNRNGSGTGSQSIPAAPESVAEEFLKLSLSARGAEGYMPLEDPPDREEIRNTLLCFFEILKKSGFEFAYRTADEVLRYAQVSYALTQNEEEDGDAENEWDVKAVLDYQILQKLLPKLHGSRRRIEPTLVALAKLCEGAEVDEAKNVFVDNSSAVVDYTANIEESDEDQRFPKSLRKLKEMIQTVRRDQFVSFIQ